MKLTGEYRIPAPRDAVWLALNDTEILKASIDQVEELEWTGPADLRTTIRARVGPVKARFRGTVELTEVDAPHTYTLIGKGDGGVAGFAKATARVRLQEAEDPGETVFLYDCDAEIGGRLSTMGGSLVRGLADRATDAFFENFAIRLAVAIATREASVDEDRVAEDVDPLHPDQSDTSPGLPFSWSGAAAGLAERLDALDDEPARAAPSGVAVPHREGLVPLSAAMLIIAAGWVAMAGILLLLFAL